MTKYYQCRLEKETPDGIEKEVAWIEENIAEVGKKVEVKGKDGLYTILNVTNQSMSSVQGII